MSGRPDWVSLFPNGDAWQRLLREAMYGRGAQTTDGWPGPDTAAQHVIVLEGTRADGTTHESMVLRPSGIPLQASGQSCVLKVKEVGVGSGSPWLLKMAKPEFAGHLRREWALGTWDGLPVPASRLRVEGLWVPGMGRTNALVREWVDGDDLLDHWQVTLGWFDTPAQAPVFPDALETMVQVSKAVAKLHTQGVTHRDLKPANVFVRAGTREVVLIDLGLAKWVRAPAGARDAAQDENEQAAEPAPTTLTKSGAGAVGTPCYHPRNAADRAYKAAAPTWDVYALAAMALECLTRVYKCTKHCKGFGQTPVGNALATNTLTREMLDGVFRGTPAAKKELLDLLFAQVDPAKWEKQSAAAGMAEHAGAFGAALAEAIK